MFINRKDRWENWDYSNAGYYFVRIVTKNRINHYPECELDEFVIMPNHIHGKTSERIPSFVGSFKSAVSRKIHLLGEKGFKWQKSFHDWMREAA